MSDLLARLKIDGESQGAVQAIAQTEAGLGSLSGAQTKAASAAAQMSAEILQTSTALNEAYGAGVKAGEGAKQAAAGYRTLWADTNRDFFTNHNAQAAKAAAAHGAVTQSTKLLDHELLNLSRQLSDVGVSAAMGMNPLMILIQQGPQISDVFQSASSRGVGFAASMRQIGSIALSVLGKAGPVGIGVAVLGTLGFAFEKASQDAAKLHNALQLTGNYAGLTASSFEAMAARISKSSNASMGESRAAVLQLVQTGAFTGQALEDVARAAERYAQLTGRSTKDILADFSAMKGNVVDWSVKHVQAYHDLTLAQIERADSLVRQGKAEAAEAYIANQVRVEAEKMTVQYGWLEGALHGASTAAKGWWDDILGLGKPETLKEQIDKTKAQIERIQQQTAGNSGLGAQMLRGQLPGLQQNLTNYTAEQTMQQQAADAQAAARKAELDKILERFGHQSGPQDQSQAAIDAAKKAELQAQLGLTKDVEAMAGLKAREIAVELEAEKDQLDRQVKERSITAAAAAIAKSHYEAVATLKLRNVAQEKEFALADQAVAQRGQLSNFTQAALRSQAAMASSAADRAALEAQALQVRQEQDRLELATKTNQQVTLGQITSAERQALLASQKWAQATEAVAAAIQANVQAARETLEQQAAERRNQIDLLGSQGNLLTSSYARALLSLQMLKLEQEDERRHLESVTVLNGYSRQEEELAQKRLKVLGQIHENEQAVAKRETTVLKALQEAASAVDDFKSAWARHDWASVFQDLKRTIETIQASFTANGTLGGIATAGTVLGQVVGGKTGQVIGTSAGILGAGVGLGAFAGTAAGASALGSIGLGAGAVSGIAAFAGPVALAAAAAYALYEILKREPTNAGAGAGIGANGALTISGNKRTSETEQAATVAATSIFQGEEILRKAGATLGATVNGLVIGTRDLSAIYLSNGRTLTSAVGDAADATDTALKAVLEDATFAHDGEKALVTSMLAAGKGFDDIAAALQNYQQVWDQAQGLSQGLADQILELTDPKGAALQAVHRAIEQQRTGAEALATAGYLTAEQLGGINAQLTVLENLQLDGVMKRFATAVETATVTTVDLSEQQREAASLQTSVGDQILQITDPAAYERKKVNDGIDQQIATARPLIDAGVLGAGILDQLEQLRGLQLVEVMKRFATAVEGGTGAVANDNIALTKLSDAFAEARPRLLAWLDQIALGPSAELSPQAQRDEALAQFNRRYAQAQGGDAGALGDITGYADRLFAADRTATSSAADRLGLYHQVTGQISSLAASGAGGDPVVNSITALTQALKPVTDVSTVNQTAIAADGGSPVVLVNLPAIRDMYETTLAAQGDRLVAANDRVRTEIVAELKALETATADAATKVQAAVEQGMAAAASAAGAAAEGAAAQAAAGAEMVEQARLTNLFLRQVTNG